MTKDEVVQGVPEVEMFGFKPDETVKDVQIYQLEKSIRVEGKHGRVLQTRPVQSWNVLTAIMGLFAQQSQNYTMDHIYVQKRNSFPMINDQDKGLGYNRESCPINKWMFDKLVTSFVVPNIGDKLVSARLGVSFSEDGIQIAFGMNVQVCSNFAILGGDIMSTFKSGGRESLSWESVEIKLGHWISTLDQKMKVEMELMNRMIQRKIEEPAVVERVIGGLYKKAIDQAYGSKAIAPFDTAGMSNFVQNIIKSPAEVEDHQFNQGYAIKNVWDLYNYGTQVMKPGMVDIAEIQQSSALFADYLFDEFEIVKN